MRKLFFSLLGVLCAFSISAQSECTTTQYTGHATYYLLLDQGSIGNCTFENDSLGIAYAAAATQLYAGSDACGVCLEVTGNTGTRTIQVVDQCPTCTAGTDLDLGPDIFEEIVGPLSVGYSEISFFEIACPWDTKPITVYIQGSNEWYGKVIIANHKNRINRVEINNGGSWVDMVRGTDNGWVKGGLGGHAAYEIRVTDIFGETVTVTGVDLRVGDGKVNGTDNFTPCFITSSNEINWFDYIQVFPNPTQDFVQIEGMQQVEQIQIFDVSGQLVYAESFSGITTQTTLDISSLLTGVYQINFISKGHSVQTKRMLKL